MNPVSSVGGSPQANEPATPTSKRAASVSPGEMRATETDDSPLSDLGSSPFSPPSPSPFRPSTHGSGSTTRLRPSSIKHRKTGSEGTQLSSRSVQFSLDEPQTRVVEWDDDEGSDVSSSEGEESGSDYEQSLRLASKPKCRVATGPKPSPKHRSVTKSSVGRGVKKLVLAADPKHLGYAICLLTNTPKPKKSCQFCHVLARRTRAEILAMLEWWWQLPYWTLYVDTRYNIFVLMANWHLAMDGNDWTLVPHHTLITDLSNWTNEMLARDPTGYNKDERSPISKSYRNKTEFVYYLLALSDDMEDVAIDRYDDDFNPRARDHHFYPFSTIGQLVSHIHPHFVVYSAGQKLFDMSYNMGEDKFEIFVRDLAAVASFGHDGDDEQVKLANEISLGEIMDIHRAWSSTEYVPKHGSGHEWRHNAEEPAQEPAQEQAQELVQELAQAEEEAHS